MTILRMLRLPQSTVPAAKGVVVVTTKAPEEGKLRECLII